MGGNQVSSIFDNNVVTGQSQSGLWLGKTDDLWSWGKPQGSGSVWREDRVGARAASDPFLMTGFDHKVLHLSYDGNNTNLAPMLFAVELDTLGTAIVTGRWRRVTMLTLDPQSGISYVPYAFPAGMSAHWARLQKMDDNVCDSCTATFTYT